MIKRLTSIALFAIAGLAIGCSDDDAPGRGGAAGTGGADPVSFAVDVHPLLLRKCAGGDCHSVDVPNFLPGHAAEDVDEAYLATQASGLGGEPVYERMLARVTAPEMMMPPDFANPPCEGVLGEGGCLTEQEVALIEAWVAAGAPP